MKKIYVSGKNPDYFNLSLPPRNTFPFGCSVARNRRKIKTRYQIYKYEDSKLIPIIGEEYV